MNNIFPKFAKYGGEGSDRGCLDSITFVAIHRLYKYKLRLEVITLQKPQVERLGAVTSEVLSLWNMHVFYMKYACCLYETCMLSIWNMHVFYMKYTCCLYEICMLSIWNMHVVYMKYACCLYEICILSMWNMHVFFMKYTCCLYEICI